MISIEELIKGEKAKLNKLIEEKDFRLQDETVQEQSRRVDKLISIYLASINYEF